MAKREILAFLKRFFKENGARYGIRRLGIFGSAARDDMGPQSDIDIVVELSAPDMFALIGIKQAVEESLKRPVDIVRYRENMNPFLKTRIIKEAVYA